MLSVILFGSILAILIIDRVPNLVSLMPWFVDMVFFIAFRNEEDCQGGCDKRNTKKLFSFSASSSVYVPEEIDYSLTSLTSKIYTNFFTPIASSLNLSSDVHSQCQFVIKEFMSSIVRRAGTVDVKSLVYHDFLRKIITHIDTCKVSREFEQVERACEKDILKRLQSSDQLHSGMHFDGKDKYSYANRLSEAILSHSLSAVYKPSRLTFLLIRSLLCDHVIIPIINCVASPSNINYYLYSFLKGDMRTQSQTSNKDSPPSVCAHSVPVLHNISHAIRTNSSSIEMPPKVFMITWKHLTSNPSLLYVFMQVLKKTSTFKIPHFCISIEELSIRYPSVLEDKNEKWSDVSITEFLEEVSHVNNVFISPESSEHIDFPPDILQSFATFDKTDANIENVISIIKVLRSAYRTSLNLLSDLCLSAFYRTPEFYMLCLGDKPVTHNPRTSFHFSKSRKEFETIHSSVNECDSNNICSSRNMNSGAFYDYCSDDDQLSDAHSFESVNSELTSTSVEVSNWMVEIKSLARRIIDSNRVYEFIIRVTSPSSQDGPLAESWEVRRQYKEFYNLEHRLKRFHGTRINKQLPTKRTIFYKSDEFFNACRKPFQDYIQGLLRNPYLRHSVMLHSFLRKPGGGPQAYFTKASSIDTGRAIQSVIGTFSTEKGKCIENFMGSFASTTETSKPRNPSNKGHYQRLSQKLSYLTEQTISSTNIRDLKWVPNPRGSLDLVHNAAKTILRIINLSRIYSFIFNLIYTLTGGILEIFFHRYVSYQVDKISTPATISSLIDTLSNGIPGGDGKDDSDRNKRPVITASQLVDAVHTKIPDLVINMFGEAQLKNAIIEIVELLQMECLNTQLAYVLLDDLVSQLFPELVEERM